MNSVLIATIIFSVCYRVRCTDLEPFDYCTIDCGGGPKMHTVCKYPQDGGDSCKEYKQGLSDDEKKTILDMHNKFRQGVASGKTEQPTASNMAKLQWDDELAMIAQWWSIQCSEYFNHDTCRNTRDGEKVGQNLAIGSGSLEVPNKIEEMVTSWYKEIENIRDTSIVDSFNPPDLGKVGHYTQMVWALTTKVGCGYSKQSTGSKQYMLACNYKATGNFRNEPIYLRGEACSQCPSGTRCSDEYPGLCDNGETQNINNKPTRSTATYEKPSETKLLVLYCITLLHYFVYIFLLS